MKKILSLLLTCIFVLTPAQPIVISANETSEQVEENEILQENEKIDDEMNEGQSPEESEDKETLDEEIDEAFDGRAPDEQSVAELEQKDEFTIEGDEPEEEASGFARFSTRASQSQMIMVDKTKCPSATIPLQSMSDPTQQHSYLQCLTLLGEYLGVNAKNKNYYDIRIQGTEAAIHKNYVTMLDKSRIKSAPYYENRSGRVYHVIEDNPTESGSYWVTKALGKAPSWMTSNKRYYSFDGIYFVDSIEKLGNRDSSTLAVNKGAPYYDYFLYLPMRTKTNYTASQLDQAFNYRFEKSGFASKTTKMKNIGKDLKDAEEKYGVNALALMAMAIHESAYGTSDFAVDRNNLFGIAAYDNDSGQATYFKSIAQNVTYQADDLSWSYGDAAFHNGFKYYGFHFGTKGAGMNVRYASDSLWGESISNHMYELDNYLGGKDNGYHSYSMIPQGAKVYNNANGSSQIYSYKYSSSELNYMYPIVTLGNEGSYTKVRNENPNSGDSGLYSWNRNGYISTKQSIPVKDSGNVKPEPKETHLSYQAHIQKNGWLSGVTQPDTAGTTGEFLNLEGFKASVMNADVSGSIEYRSLVNKSGWESSWKKDGQLSGTERQGIYIEALQMKLTGELAKKYDIYYRVHSADYGWLDWTKNGEKAGTEGFGLRAEAFQATLVLKDEKAPGSTARPYVKKEVQRTPKLTYQAHIQRSGWIPSVKEGQLGGTTGKYLRLEGFKINLDNDGIAGNIEYRSLVNQSGWESTWKNAGQTSGTERKGIAVEAFQIRLTGDLAESHDVYYRAHTAKYGWLDWTKNGAKAGTEGANLQAEAFEVRLVKKGGTAPGATKRPYVKEEKGTANLTSQAHVAKHGWLSPVKEGKVTGTEGEFLRLEAFKIKINNADATGNIEYRSHLSKYGWQSGWKRNNQMSGTTGEYQRVEAMQIRLTGEMAMKYDVYYRVHSAKYGWLD